MDLSTATKSTRRNFLTRFLVGWSMILFAPVVYIIYKYIVPPKFKEKIMEILAIGNIADFPINSARILKFNKTPLVIVHTEEGQVKAYSAVCTHLGCIVQYKNEDKSFHCNCHGSVFDLNGKNIVGPASKPLIPFKVVLKENNINVLKS